MGASQADRVQLGARVRKLREFRGWTSVAAFAKHAGLSQSVVHRTEMGKTHPDFWNLARIAAALDVTPQYLAGMIPRLESAPLEVVVRTQSVNLFIEQNALDANDAESMRALAEHHDAPTTVEEWRRFRSLFSRFEELREARRSTLRDMRQFPSTHLRPASPEGQTPAQRRMKAHARSKN